MTARITSSLVRKWRCASAVGLAACLLGGIGAAAGADDPSRGAAAVASVAELREIVALLMDDDMAVRRAASDRLVALGDPALVVIEEEIAAGRIRPGGQAKIALLALRAQRLDRQWNERIAQIVAKPWRRTFVRVVDGRPSGEIEYRLARTPAPNGDVDARRGPSIAPPATLALEVVECEGAARSTTRALLSTDRTLSPAAIDTRRPPGDGDTHATIAAGRVIGTAAGAIVDRTAPPPMILDLAAPLVALAMPREVGAELVCTVLHAHDLAVSGTANLRCVRREERDVDGRRAAVFVYELAGDGPARRIEIGDDDAILLAELRPGLQVRLGRP